MAASWSLSHTLGTKEKVFSWRIDYRNSLDSENEGSFMDRFSKNSLHRVKVQEGLQETLKEILKEESVQRIEQTNLSAFFGL